MKRPCLSSPALLVFVPILCGLACGGSELECPPTFATHSLELIAGQTQDAELGSIVDDAPVGTMWEDAALSDSILAPMFARTVIVKADDLRIPTKATFSRYLNTMASRGLPATVGLITEGLLTEGASDEERRCYGKLDPRVTELWFHGHTHRLGAKSSEFQRTPLEEQRKHFSQGLDLMARELGIIATSFGAPGNGVDENTVTAITENAQIEATLFAPHIPGAMFFPRILALEQPTHKVVARDAFEEGYRSLDPNEVFLTLQGHPNTWTEERWSRFEQIVDFLSISEGLRFSTAHATARWVMDVSNLTVEKIGPRNYRIDSTQASYNHLVTLVH